MFCFVSNVAKTCESWFPLLYILTSIWVLRMPNAGRISHFQHFCCKKAKKKKEICSKFLQKNRFFKFAPERWSTVLFPKTWAFCWKWLFGPAFGVRSNQMLVEIYNTPWSCVLIPHLLDHEVEGSNVNYKFPYIVGCRGV